ncbi:hypothetical protein JB92DRAFT_2956505, partial [Gautieria morchelliformis]
FSLLPPMPSPPSGCGALPNPPLLNLVLSCCQLSLALSTLCCLLPPSQCNGSVHQPALFPSRLLAMFSVLVCFKLSFGSLVSFLVLYPLLL